MTEADYGDLVPPAFDTHTIVLLVRPPDPPAFTADELDALQREHLRYLRDLGRSGVVVANGPFVVADDERVRGMTVYAVGREEAERHALADPMVRAGRLAVEVREWLTGRGSVAFSPDGWPRGSG
jgi:uncharacterized protein